MLDAEDRAVLRQSLFYVGLVTLGVPSVAVLAGVAWRLFRLTAGV